MVHTMLIIAHLQTTSMEPTQQDPSPPQHKAPNIPGDESHLEQDTGISEADPHSRVVHKYENVTLQRTKSEALRSRRNVYENAPVLGMPVNRRFSEAALRPVAKVEPQSALPQSFERQTSLVDITLNSSLVPADTFGTLNVHSERNISRRSHDYENVEFGAKGGSLGHGQAHGVGFKSQPAEDDIDDDDSFLSESDFDSNADDTFEICDKLSLSSGASLHTDTTQVCDSLSNICPNCTSIHFSWQSVLTQKSEELLIELINSETAYVERLHFLCRVS